MVKFREQGWRPQWQSPSPIHLHQENPDFLQPNPQAFSTDSDLPLTDPSQPHPAQLSHHKLEVCP
jgi:hypothetical protein